MKIGINLPLGQEHAVVNLGVRRSQEAEVRFGDIILDPLSQE